MWAQALSNQIRVALSSSLESKGIKEWEAPSRAIAGICMIIVAVEHGIIRFDDAKGLLNEVCRRIFVCCIRETARDLVLKTDAIRQSSDLPTQVEELSAMVSRQLMSLPPQLYETAQELCALGYCLHQLLDGTKDKITSLKGRQDDLYTNMDYGVSFIYRDISTIERARELSATCLILMRSGLEAYISECPEEALKRQNCTPPAVDATYVYSETRAARSVKIRWGKVTDVSFATSTENIRKAFLLALDSKDKKGTGRWFWMVAACLL